MNDFKKCEDKILKIESEIEELNESLNLCGADFVKAAEISENISAKEEELMELYETFEALEKEIEEKGYNL